jgi:predicted transcriptional regulator
MAMTLRMDTETEAALDQLASATHRSRNDAVQFAIRRAAAALTIEERYAAALADVDERDADLMERLSR